MADTYTPRDYQIAGTAHIIEHQRCALWARMGTGKTIMTLSAIEAMKALGSNALPVLVIAPLRVARGGWPREAARWEHTRHLRVSAMTGTRSERLAALKTRADIYTINPENIPWLMHTLGKNWPFRWVVYDESTQLRGYRHKAGTRRALLLSRVAFITPRWTNLTGTPSPNKYVDLWGPQYFVDRGERLGRTFTAFRETYFDSDEYTRTVTLKEYARHLIPELLSDVCLSIDHQLPVHEPIDAVIEVELPARARQHYTEVYNELVSELDSGSIVAANAAARTIKCLQIASGAVYDDEHNVVEVHDEKIKALREVVEDCNGSPLLVSYWWKHDATRILKAFPEARVLRTQQDEDDWNAGRIPIGLAHPQSIGHGSNLQYGGHHFCYFSDWWNLELHDQIFERVGPVRQYQAGFDRPVHRYSIVAADTLDALMQVRHTQKRDVQELLMERCRR